MEMKHVERNPLQEVPPMKLSAPAHGDWNIKLKPLKRADKITKTITTSLSFLKE